MSIRVRRLLAAGSTVLLAAGLSAGCASDPAPSGIERGLEGSMTVFAAASLTDAMTEIGAAFEAAHPGVTVQFNFAGSSSLREQIFAGAPADVFASANRSNMDDLVAAGEASGPVDFASNDLQIVVPAGNPAGIEGLADFATAGLLVGLCAEQVPCGALGRMALAEAGVAPSVDTDEPDVRALLTKVEAGELDVGLVYRTDVISAGAAVEGIDLPAGVDVVATYPIAVLERTEGHVVAHAFVDFVVSAEGQAILERFGFDGP